MESGGGVAVDRLADLAHRRARAEAHEIIAMMQYREIQHARIDQLEHPLRRQLERAAIALEIGQAMGLSEAQVLRKLATASRVQERAAATWMAFRSGRLDYARLAEISATLDVLERPDSWRRLDLRVVAYARTHTVAELRRWLRRFVQRVETDLALERAERARKDRRVEITQGDDGMATLWALLPAPVAAAIARRLAKEAKAFGADDPRTLGQRKADLLAAHLTTNDNGEPAVGAQIAVKLPADVFAGARDGFAEAADGSWSAPAHWLLDLDLIKNPVFHRIVVDPVTDDVLAHQYVGRFAPETLATALAFRDGVCRAPGCLVPSDRCDLDHREPWPEGPTSGENMWPLCRRHHALKGHQILQWVLPSGHTVAADLAS